MINHKSDGTHLASIQKEVMTYKSNEITCKKQFNV